MIDTRFPTALQMMLTLAYAHENGVAQLTSAQLANGLGSTPSLARKLLVPLVRDELVRSTMGKRGGLSLARPADAITLANIYFAVVGDKTLFTARLDVPHLCVVSSRVEDYFQTIAGEADRAVLRMLEERTLAMSLAELLKIKNEEHPVVMISSAATDPASHHTAQVPSRLPAG